MPHLTEQMILDLKSSNKQYDVRDDDPIGFMVRVNTNGSKTYYVEYGRGRRVKICRFGQLPLKTARIKAKEIQVQAKNGQLDKRTQTIDMTYSQYLEEIDRQWLKANTKRGERYYKMLKLHFVPIFGNTKLSEISAFELEKWKNTRVDNGIEKDTVDRDLAAFKASINRAVKLKLIKYNPVSEVTKFNVNKQRVRYLSEDERNRLMDKLRHFDKYFQVIVILALNTGLRKSNIIELNWKDVILDSEYPHVLVEAINFKGNRMHSVPLNNTAQQTLLNWKQDNPENDEWVFTNPATGKPYADVKRQWDRLRKLSGLTGSNNFRFHDQRHECASRLVKKGVDLYTVSKVLGHADVTMTQRYAHLAPKALADAVAKLD